ncbi:MAG: glycosyltransferase, partial [Planctomycetes bacterium]|nr:glycosyltransferase [Planctomycetota bacterium]
MKLLVIAKRPPWPIHYGDRLHCYELVQRLAQRHEVLLVAQKPSEVSDWAFDFECRVARDGRLFEDQPDLAAEGFVADRIDRYFGIDMGFARDVVKLVGEWQPDVVIGMNYHSLPALARIKGVPTICDLLDDETLHALLELRHSRSTGKLDRLKCVLATALFQRRYIRQVDAVTVPPETDRRLCRLPTGHR